MPKDRKEEEIKTETTEENSGKEVSLDTEKNKENRGYGIITVYSGYAVSCDWMRKAFRPMPCDSKVTRWRRYQGECDTDVSTASRYAASAWLERIRAEESEREIKTLGTWKN